MWTTVYNLYENGCHFKPRKLSNKQTNKQQQNNNNNISSNTAYHIVDNTAKITAMSCRIFFQSSWKTGAQSNDSNNWLNSGIVIKLFWFVLKLEYMKVNEWSIVKAGLNNNNIPENDSWQWFTFKAMNIKRTYWTSLSRALSLAMH